MAAAPFPLVDLGGAEEVWPDASHSWVSGMSCRRSRALCRASASRGGFGCAFMCRSWLSRLTVARELSCTAALLDRRMARARVRCGGRRLPLSPAARSADCERSAKEVQEQNAALISRSGLNLCPASSQTKQGPFVSLLRSGWRGPRLLAVLLPQPLGPPLLPARSCVTHGAASQRRVRLDHTHLHCVGLARSARQAEHRASHT